MISQFFSIPVLFLIINLILFIPMVIVLAKLWKKNEQKELALQHLKQELSTVCASAMDMGKRVNLHDDKISSLVSRQNQIDLREPVIRSYRQAKSLLDKGAGVDELISHCGVTPGEAELITVLHQLELKNGRSEVS